MPTIIWCYDIGCCWLLLAAATSLSSSTLTALSQDMRYTNTPPESMLRILHDSKRMYIMRLRLKILMLKEKRNARGDMRETLCRCIVSDSGRWLTKTQGVRAPNHIGRWGLRTILVIEESEPYWPLRNPNHIRLSKVELQKNKTNSLDLPYKNL